MNKRTKARIDPVEVYARIRPVADEDAETCVRVLDEGNLMLEIPECSNAYRTGHVKKVVYSFSKIFDETVGQKEIFNDLGLPLVKDLLEGKNGLLFSYGVTGSGKTYSMIGNQHEPGILQRCLDTVFNSISFTQAKKYLFKPDKANSFEIQSESDAMQDRKTLRDVLAPATPISTSRTVTSVIQQFNTGHVAPTTPFRSKAIADARRLNSPNGKIVNVVEEHVYAVFISCIEIYNNYIYDLLDEFSSSSDSSKRMDNSKESKNLKEDAKGCMYIKDAVEIEVKSTEEALELMHRAQKRRVVAYTDLNSESSRSHSIFTIRIVQANYDPNSDEGCSGGGSQNKSKANVFVSQLSLVDLAGSERTKRTKNTGSRLREAGNINSSLMALRNCMEALRENIMNGTKKIVPYRDSKLTLLFKNYFEGNGRIKMVLCINPRSIEFDETINVLKFSDLVKDILLPGQGTSDVQRHLARHIADKTLSADALEDSCSQFFNKYLQSNHLFSTESFPALDVYNSEDTETLNGLVTFLEEYRSKHTPFVHEFESLRQQYFGRLKDSINEIEKLREERDDYKHRLDTKERDQSKFDSKLKALEKVINTNNYRTPNVATSNNKENNRPNFATPSRGIMNSNSGSSSKYSHHHITGAVSGQANRHEQVKQDPSAIERNNSNDRPSTISFPKTPITSTFRQETPVQQSSYRSSRVVHGTSTVTQSINRFQNHASSNAHLPPQTPFKEGVPVANRRNQRRSKSAEMWLDHKPVNTAKIDTVMQPKFGRKKSVSKVELCDAKKSSRYVLTHQQQDQNGEVITNLIKGDILKSPSGGANCIFTDIEVLNVHAQEQAKTCRKRISVEETVDEGVVNERCAISIEGHNRSKPYKKTKISSK